MSSRRKFIKEAALGAVGIGIIERALKGVALASPENGFNFFSPLQAEIVEAMAERIWPSTKDAPGAIAAGVVFYIDRSLSQFYRDLQDAYRHGIDSVNSYAMKKFGGGMAKLSEQQQDEVLTNLEKNTEEVRPFFVHPSANEFFGLILKHTHEGLFSDPIYGGNRNFVGWKSIGYTGPRYYYTAEMQTTFAPLNLPTQGLADL